MTAGCVFLLFGSDQTPQTVESEPTGSGSGSGSGSGVGSSMSVRLEQH